MSSNPFIQRSDDLASQFNWIEVARLILLSRSLDRLEENEMTDRVRLQLSAQGHELAQILVALSLDHSHDAASIYYRSRPFLLASGLSPAEALKASLAKVGSPSEGRDVGVIFNMQKRSGATVLPTSGNVGAQFTPAVGWAQAIRYYAHSLGRSEWDGAIAVAMGGEGSTASNGFWAALNIATTLNLPVLFVIEDNGFAISVPSEMQTPGGNIARNLESFRGLRILETDGACPWVASCDVQDAVRHVRSGQGPCLLRVTVPRLNGHSYADDQRYKTGEQLRSEEVRDPIFQFRTWLAHEQLPAQLFEDMCDEVACDVSEALKEADAAEEPTVETLPTTLLEADSTAGVQVSNNDDRQLNSAAERNDPAERVDFREAVQRTFYSELEQNDRVVLFGQDVGVLGGLHGFTRGLQQEFGDERVFDTSLSEEGIVGRAVGMAFAGLRPVTEIQFRRYADAGLERIIDTGTIHWRTNGKFQAPVVIRMPVGMREKGGDPWHSACDEAIFAHSPGLVVAFPSTAEDAVGLLRTALRGKHPCVFLEHLKLIRATEACSPMPSEDHAVPFGKAAIRQRGSELTLVTWGASVHACVEACRDLEGQVTVIDLRTIMPWDREAVMTSVRETGRLLVVHEDTLTCGFGAEVVATVAANCFSCLKMAPQRLATPDCPIPYNANLALSLVPDAKKIRDRIIKLLKTDPDE